MQTLAVPRDGQLSVVIINQYNRYNKNLSNFFFAAFIDRKKICTIIAGRE